MTIEEERASDNVERERAAERLRSASPRIPSFIAGGLGKNLGASACPRPSISQDRSGKMSHAAA
jgi:hypothetical protein